MTPADLNRPLRRDPTLELSPATWASARLVPRTLRLVQRVWSQLESLEAAGHDGRALAALRYPLVAHQPTSGGRCRVCSRRWGRRRLWPCVMWRQISHELCDGVACGG